MKKCLRCILLVIFSSVIVSPAMFSAGILGCVHKDKLKKDLEKVARWQIAHFSYSTEGSVGYLHDYGIDAWTNGVLYLGLTRLAAIANQPNEFYEWLKKIGEENSWRIPANFIESKKYSLYHADELCIGQFYLAMYDKFDMPKMIESTRVRANWIMNNPPNKDMKYTNKQSWTWCDALFMAPPVYAHLAQIDNDTSYLIFMDQHFKKTYSHLYNKEQKLFYRDDSYFEKKEQNGEAVFWGRGNGWVAAGLANILKLLPKESAYRNFYEELFKELVISLVGKMNEGFYWHASLLDTDSYPSPEASATAMIAYAMAYGINNDLLSREVYLPILINVWNSLNTFVDDEGKLGWVQPIGADPKSVTSDMTAVYGVGAYLLAGCEIFEIDFKDFK